MMLDPASWKWAVQLTTIWDSTCPVRMTYGKDLPRDFPYIDDMLITGFTEEHISVFEQVSERLCIKKTNVCSWSPQ